MKIAWVSLFSLCWIATAVAGPLLERNLDAIKVWDREFHLVRTITKKAELEHMASLVRSASEVKEATNRPAHFTHAIDMPARWLYDARSGELVLLSMASQPVYRLSGDQKAEFDTLISPAPNRPSSPPSPRNVDRASVCPAGTATRSSPITPPIFESRDAAEQYVKKCWAGGAVEILRAGKNDVLVLYLYGSGIPDIAIAAYRFVDGKWARASEVKPSPAGLHRACVRNGAIVITSDHSSEEVVLLATDTKGSYSLHVARRNDRLRAIYPIGTTTRADVQKRWGAIKPDWSETRPPGGWSHHQNSMLATKLPTIERNARHEVARFDRYWGSDGASLSSLCYCWFYYDSSDHLVDVEWMYKSD